MTQSITLAICVAVGGFLAACSAGGLYKVKPFAKLPPMPESAKAADLGSISFRAAPLLTDEESHELFESNLHLAGLLPVRIEIIHNSGEAVEFKKVRLRLHDAAGTEWKPVPAKKAVARILKANDIYAYNPHSRKIFEKEFGAYELNLKEPFTHPEHRRGGFLFFQSPKKEPVASPHGLVLTVEGLSKPATITIN